VIDALDDQAAFDAWLAEQRPQPARAVSLDEMRRWTRARIREVRERSSKQLAKDWRRTTPDKAARVHCPSFRRSIRDRQHYGALRSGNVRSKQREVCC
jgi:hypothetical protein